MRSKLEAAGIAVSLAPLLEIIFEPVHDAIFTDAAGLIVTSRNALKAIAKRRRSPQMLGLPIFAVGPATAHMARDLGFVTVIEGPGTAAGLAPVIAGHVSAASAISGQLVHLAGDRQAYDLAADLAARGINISSCEVYRSVAAKTLPGDVVEDLNASRAGAVILMSPETARTWQLVSAQPPVTADLSKLVHLCLSDAVARALAPNPDLKIEIASNPNVEQMLALAIRLAAKSAAT